MHPQTTHLRLAPGIRCEELIERLAGVPHGTYAAYSEQLSDISNQDLHAINIDEIAPVIQESYALLRVEPHLRKMHDFMSEWFGPPTELSNELLSLWGHKRPNGSLEPGVLDDPRKVALLMQAQAYPLPLDVRLEDLGGIEWKEHGTLELHATCATRSMER